MNDKEKVVRKLEGLKKYRLYWENTVNKCVTVEARNEKEAREMFYDGDVDYENAEEGDINYLEDSLEIEEE